METTLKSNFLFVPEFDSFIRSSIEIIETILKLKTEFNGTIFTDFDNIVVPKNSNLYICGKIDNYNFFNNDFNIFIIRELSENYLNSNLPNISLGEVPINVFGLGIYLKQVFNTSLFEKIIGEHNFQLLTESNKPNFSLRKGIYLSNINQTNNGLEFNLLRCSTNLDGPTDNFRETDRLIIDKVNNLANTFFNNPADCNHVLAQIYENKIIENKHKKASIKAHSDKTKDMPENGLMAFVTFYDNSLYSNDDIKFQNFDYLYRNCSVLTTMNFRLKPDILNSDLPDSFNVTLYPGSVLLIPLSTNRLYTHEIKPSSLEISKIPIRLGYVVRCSKTKAIYREVDNIPETFIIKNNGEETKLKEITENDAKLIKDLYFEENLTSKKIVYPEILTSFNNGDYKKPLI